MSGYYYYLYYLVCVNLNRPTAHRLTLLRLPYNYTRDMFFLVQPIPVRDIRISNQFLITRALHFAQPQAYYQASVTITLGRNV